MNADEWKLEFNKTGVEISKRIRNPFDDKIKDSPLDIMDYNKLIEKFENNKINMVVTKIDRKIENDIFKSLIFYVSEFKFFQSSEIQNQKIIADVNEDQKIIIFGEEKKPWRDYNDLLKITSKWLFEKNKLQTKDLPVYVPHGKQYLINSKPIHEYGKKFAGKPYEISQNMILNTNFSSDSCLTHAEHLMRKFAPEIGFKILGFQ
ncbi:MAG: hypothetical protein WA130_07140 [Candidatus Methanoperedens sp.]